MENLEHTLTPLSVIIVNHNAGDYVLNCVNSCLKQVTQIIVVDNASSDGSYGALENTFSRNKRIKLVKNKKNIGFSAACNLGYKEAVENNILFLNPDCLLIKGSMQRMFQVLKLTKDVGMIGGYLINPDQTEQKGGRRSIPTPWRSFVRTFRLHHLANQWPNLFNDYLLHKQPLPDHPIEVEMISGALIMTTRKVINQVGLLDEKYFLHCEDLDWCMRVRQHGLKIIFVPNAPIVHYGGVCSKNRTIFIEWHKHKGMIYFYKKFFRHQYPGILMALIKIGIWLRFTFLVIGYYLSATIKKVLRFKKRKANNYKNFHIPDSRSRAKD